MGRTILVIIKIYRDQYKGVVKGAGIEKKKNYLSESTYEDTIYIFNVAKNAYAILFLPKKSGVF
jgi:hypothetical protein